MNIQGRTAAITKNDDGTYRVEMDGIPFDDHGKKVYGKIVIPSIVSQYIKKQDDDYVIDFDNDILVTQGNTIFTIELENENE